MSHLKEKDFITELAFCIREADIIKAKALLQFFPTISAPFQSRALYEISKANPAFALYLFEYLLGIEIQEVAVREKLYEVLLDQSYRNQDLPVELLSAGLPENKRICVRVIQDMRLRDALPNIVGLLTIETHVPLLKDALKALAKLGNDAHVPTIAEFIFYDNEELKNTALFGLAEIGTRNALAALRKVSGTVKVNQLIIDTIEASIDSIESTLPADKYQIADETQQPAESGVSMPTAPRFRETTAPQPDVSTQPAATPPAQGDKTPPAGVPISPRHDLLGDLSAEDGQKRFACIEQLRALGGDKQLYDMFEAAEDVTRFFILQVLPDMPAETSMQIIQNTLFSTPRPVFPMTFWLYNAMAQLPEQQVAVRVIDGMEDRDERVRIAAATAVNVHGSDVHLAGLKSRIESGGKTPAKIVSAIIDAKADRLFSGLLLSDTFMHHAVGHLSHEAHPAIRDHYIGILIDRGMMSVARAVEFDRMPPSPDTHPVIWILHPSQPIRYYLKKHAFKAGLMPMAIKNVQDAVRMICRYVPRAGLCSPCLDSLETRTFLDGFHEIIGGPPPQIFLLHPGIDGSGADLAPYPSLPIHADPSQLFQAIHTAAGQAFTALPAEQIPGRIVRLLKSDWLNVRYGAKAALAAVGSSQMDLLEALIQNRDPFFKLTAIDALARIHNDTATGLLIETLLEHDTDTAIRFACLDALQHHTVEMEELFPVRQIYEETEPAIRMATLLVMSRNLTPFITSQFKSLIEQTGPLPRRIVGDIITAGAENLFMSLIGSDAFTHQATRYLSNTAPGIIRDTYINRLRRSGNVSLAGNIIRALPPQDDAAHEQIIYVICRSPLIRNMVETRLHTAGYAPFSFKSWSAATEMLDAATPAALIADIWVNGKTAPDALRDIRKQLPRQQAPLLLFSPFTDYTGTYQQSRSLTNLKKGAVNQWEADVILRYPPHPESLRLALESVLTPAR
ncbi:MAG: hypothetical protein CSA22_06650 [Deltaproteobacteria bacterium]|nr:MAG: hypothetical protein CSA22_06650 [Deltaproteobacteria bacterium]